MKIIIVGGVAGGMSAATRLRRLMEDAEITVYEQGPYVSFANCGLPYFVSGEIADKDALVVQTPTALKARFNLDVRTHSRVTAIDPDAHTVTVQDQAGTHTDHYDRLILSPGARPFIPAISGLDDAKNAFPLRNIPDLEAIMARLNGPVKRATVVGAGFIGIEMAENLARRGLDVTLVEQAPHVLPPLDEEMAAFVAQTLTANGLTVMTNTTVTGFADAGQTLTLSTGDTLQSDLTLMSVGVRPNSELAKAAGIKLGLRDGILIDDHYQTSAPDVYAVGDAVVLKQQITGEDALIPLASPANRAGRQVADVIAGLPAKNRGAIGTSIVRAFNTSAASTGLSERQARAAGFNVSVAHTVGNDHAGYYPGATSVILKLIWETDTGRILGAQGIGNKGVDKRIDILATAIKGRLTVFDLPELELTYAPPFGVAKDPVNMLGYVAGNQEMGLSHTVQWHELDAALAGGAQIVDVRNADELANGSLPNATHIPLAELRDRLGELDPEADLIVSCQSGLRSYIAERILTQHGFKHVHNLDGAFLITSTVRPDLVH